jgi:hypothetical protein
VFPARYELNSYIVFRKRLVSKRLNEQLGVNEGSSQSIGNALNTGAMRKENCPVPKEISKIHCKLYRRYSRLSCSNIRLYVEEEN